MQKLKELKFQTPYTVLVKEKKDLKKISPPFALKPCYSRGSFKVIQVEEKAPEFKLSLENPWVAQEWLTGDRFCTYSISHQGRLTAHSCYPTDYTLGGSCLNYRSVHHPGILEWVQKFVKALNFTGQICFDFFETSEGILPIECNPRATAGIHLFSESDPLDGAFFDRETPLLLAKEGVTKQYGWGMLLYGWRSPKAKQNLKEFWKDYWKTKGIIQHRQDRLPSLLQPLMLLGVSFEAFKHGVSLPAAFTYDLDWDGPSRNS